MVTSSLTEWLKSHGLERFASVFEENEVDLMTFRMLTENDLKEIGVPFGPRKRMIHLLGEEKRLEKSAPFDTVVTVPVGERRHLTVMFCDMVGFTKLAYKLDPERLQVVIRAYEDACTTCVNRYEGYVFTTLGDGIVAFFGFPLAHEGEAERAIRAGLDIIETVSGLHIPGAGKLQVRIGIAAGMVVVTSGERNAAGETMNLASRLQSIAHPGSIVVSEPVQRLAAGRFEFEDLGEKDLKGVSGLTRVYQVLGVSEAQSRFEAATQQGMTPLVGREVEIDSLLDHWRHVRQTGAGRAVVVRGEAGLGKSRIVAALRERLRDQSSYTLVFQCSPFFVNSAFYPIRTWFERTLEFERDESPDSRLNKLEALVVNRLGLPRDDLRFVAAMLSLPYQDRYGAILISPKLAKEDTMRVLVDIVRAAAHTQPTLLLLDPTTLDVLSRLIDRLVDVPTLLVVTARPEFKSPWSDRPDVSAIELTKLTPAQSRSLIDKIAGRKALPAGLADQIVARTDGVPLFVEELTKSILESGDLVVEGDRYAFAQSSARITIPETLRDSLMARLDRVAVCKEIAQVGSVIGREFGFELIAGLELMSETALTNALRLLVGAGLANSRGDIPNAVYTFSHALVQDAAYDSLLKSRRKQLHGAVARLLEERWPETRSAAPELLAYHYTAAESYETAAPLWLHAGEVAYARFALPEAITHLRTGMSALAKLRPSKARDQAELSFRTALGPALMAHRGWGHAEVSQALEPAWNVAQSIKQQNAYLPILSALSLHYMCIDKLEESLRWADRMVMAGVDSDDDGLEIVGHRAASACHFWLGDFAAARKAGDLVRKLYDPDRHWRLPLLTNNDPFTGEGIYRAQYLWILGYPDQALAANEEMEANARRRGHPFDLAFALTLGAQLFDFLGDPEALLRRTEEAERIGKEHGIALLGEIMVEISRGVAWLRSGRPADAAAQLDRGIARLMLTGHRIWIGYLKALQAEGLALSGNLDLASALLDECVARIEAGEERSHFAEVLRLRGWLLIRKGQPTAAEATLHKAIKIARSQQAKSWELRAATTLARLLTSRGKSEKAVALLRPVYDSFTEGQDTNDLKEARELLTELGIAAGSRTRVAASKKPNPIRRKSHARHEA
jgi:class 3 adenylate cyclase/tetratricopeptide (TPR) repeat protein